MNNIIQYGKKGGILMSDKYFMGYTIHDNSGKLYYPNTVLISNKYEKFTVSMANDILDYLLSIEAIKNTTLTQLKRAKIIFMAMKRILNNQQPPKFTIDDVKLTIDILEEITNMNTLSNEQKKANSKVVLFLKSIFELVDVEINK